MKFLYGKQQQKHHKQRQKINDILEKIFAALVIDIGLIS